MKTKILSVSGVEVIAMPYPSDLPQIQQKSETYGGTREWLPSCVRMIRVGPLFFERTWGGYGRNYGAGFLASREATPRRGAYGQLTMSPCHIILGGGVSLSGKEDGRDGGATRSRYDDPLGQPPAENPARGVWNNFRTTRTVGSGHGDMPSPLSTLTIARLT
jgi:hypothetical protein